MQYAIYDPVLWIGWIHELLTDFYFIHSRKEVKVSKSDSQICKITLELGVGIDKKVSLLTYLSFYLHWEFHKVFIGHYIRQLPFIFGSVHRH